MALFDKHPIDVNALSKGELLNHDTLEKATGKKRDTQEYAFAVMGLQHNINSNTLMTAKITPDGLRILTDSEASEYNHGQFRQALGRTVRRHGKSLQVDASQLSPEEQKKHERQLINQSRIVQAISTARKLHVTGAQKVLSGT